MDRKKRFDIHKEASRSLKIGVILLIVTFVGLLFIPEEFVDPRCRYKGMAITAKCTSHLSMLGEYMYKTASKKDPETLKKLTIRDLVREMVQQREVLQEFLLCAETKEPFHVFPVPADLFSRHIDGRSATVNPVPVAMCRPNVHHMIHAGWCGWFKKFGVLVLYSDGTVKSLTTKEAEKLVAEQHPVPLEIQRPEDKRESEQGNEEAQTALNRLGAQ